MAPSSWRKAGLNDAKTRQQLDPAVREAYLGLLKSADVRKMDRGTARSVRLVFDLNPSFLEAARDGGSSAPVAPEEKRSQASRSHERESSRRL